MEEVPKHPDPPPHFLEKVIAGKEVPGPDPWKFDCPRCIPAPLGCESEQVVKLREGVPGSSSGSRKSGVAATAAQVRIISLNYW